MIMDKESLLRKIDSVSFMMTDLSLFLDTHPSDKRAAKLFMQYQKERKELLKEFSEHFYPLTMDCECKANGDADALDRVCADNCSCVWCWGKGSEPWKGCCEPASKAAPPNVH